MTDTYIKRFTLKNKAPHRKDLVNLRRTGPIASDGKPYIGLFCDGKLVSGIWIDEQFEIFYVTFTKFRNRGYLTRLIKAMVRDVDKGVLPYMLGNPINETSEKILFSVGWKRARNGDCSYRPIKSNKRRYE